MANQKKLNLSKKEWFWYILTLFLAFVGLVFAIIGIIGDHLPVIFSFALTFFSRESDRDNERAIRRAQRLAAMSEAENVVEAEEAKQA